MCGPIPAATFSAHAVALVFLYAGCSSAQAQSRVLSTSLAGPGSALLNTTSFKYPALSPLYSYPVGFPLITCNASSDNPTQALNISVGSSLVPAARADATSPYPAVHATIRVAWPNNVTGTVCCRGMCNTELTRSCRLCFYHFTHIRFLFSENLTCILQSITSLLS